MHARHGRGLIGPLGIGNWSKKEPRVQFPQDMIFGGSNMLDIAKYVVDILGWG